MKKFKTIDKIHENRYDDEWKKINLINTSIKLVIQLNLRPQKYSILLKKLKRF